MNLTYQYNEAFDRGERRHAQEVMESLGITYQKSTPRSLTESYWFWGCKNVPKRLPPYIHELGITPRQAIGHGLSKGDAEALEGTP